MTLLCFNLLFTLLSLLVKLWTCEAEDGAVKETGEVYVMESTNDETRLYRYKWKKPKNRCSDVLPEFENALVTKKSPSVVQATNVENYLKDFLSSVVVDPNSNESSEILFYGTAAFRLHPDNETAEKLIKDIDLHLSSATVNPNFLYSKNNAKIISGAQEAIYRWISENHRQRIFNIRGAKTIGVFKQTERELSVALRCSWGSYCNLFSMKLSGEKMGIYATSVNELGLGSMEEQVEAFLIENNTANAPIISNPCEFKGLTITKGQTQFMGTGNFDDCQTILDQLIGLPFASLPSYNHLLYSFYGIFYSTCDKLGVKKKSHQIDLDSIFNKTRDLCSKDGVTYTVRKDQLQCLAAAMFSKLIFTHFGASCKAFVNPSPQTNLQDWPLGAAIAYYEQKKAENVCRVGGSTKLNFGLFLPIISLALITSRLLVSNK